jgi:hypothetical protein
VPLSKLQVEILRLLASQRDPESYVAGATPLNQDALRYSSDIDVFHDREERVALAAFADARILQEAGYGVRWLRQLPTIQAAEIAAEHSSTRLEWVVDSDFRFFPTMPHEVFGYVLHPIDLAVNKVMAAAGRKEVRDLVDLLTVHQAILPLGAVIWAAVEKSPGFTPEGLIAEIRRNSQHPAAEWRALETTVPLDPKAVTQQLSSILLEAEAFVLQMPSEKAGLLFLQQGKIIQPDPARLETGEYETHAGQRRGQWPGSAEISAAMFERYTKDR